MEREATTETTVHIALQVNTWTMCRVTDRQIAAVLWKLLEFGLGEMVNGQLFIDVESAAR